jgi:hypothetical protein
MSASLFLFLDPEGKISFDPLKVRTCVKNLHGVSNWREGADTAVNDMLFDCVFRFNQERTTVVVPKGDLSFISIWGTGDASLQAALEVQRGYESPVYVAVSESPGNIVDLSTVSSLDELRKRLRR